MHSENITKVLYPNDEVIQGKTLRLQQQFFFVTCSLQDMIRVHLAAEAAARQVSREMGRPAQRHASGHRRRRVDAPVGGRTSDGLGHRLAASHGTPSPTPTTRCCPRRWRNGRWACSATSCRATWRSFTKSTAASSTRSARNFPAMTPGWPACRSSTKAANAYVRMAHLATVGSHHVNGVARLHSDLLKQDRHARFRRVVAGESSATSPMASRRAGSWR